MKKFKEVSSQVKSEKIMNEFSEFVSSHHLNYKDEKVIFDDLKILGIQSCQFTASNVELLTDNLPMLILNLKDLGWVQSSFDSEFFTKKNTRIRLRNIRLFGKDRIDLRIFSI